MTTRTEQMPAFVAPVRGFAWRQMVAAFALTLLAVAIFGAAFVAGYSALHAGKVLPGVSIGGVALAGLERAEAEAALREGLPALNAGHVTLRIADEQSQIAYAAIGRDYDMALMVDQAFGVGRQGSLLDQLSDQLHLLMNGVTLEPTVGWSDAAVAAELTALADQIYIAPSDANVVRDGGRWTVVPAVEGRTLDLQAAASAIDAAIDNISAADTQVTLTPTVLLPAVSTAQAATAVAAADAVSERSLVVVGSTGSVAIDPEQLRGWVHLQPAGVGEWQLMLSREAVEQWVTALALTTDRPAVEASFALEDGNIVPVPGQTGLLVDVPATTDEIYNHLALRAEGGSPSPAVSLMTTVTTPDFTTEEAVLAAPRVEMVSGWTTRFTPYEGNFFGNNILVPAAHLGGTVVAPGARFDFWGLMPPSLADLPGIGPGGIIKNGKTDLTGAIGGGICSVSTTMFNAAARAGLELGARKNHSYYI
ncbi:MAG TPA: peptidoglycan binding domain-containing protein, partial [Candidatus Limnocylindrales bacterium]